MFHPKTFPSPGWFTEKIFKNERLELPATVLAPQYSQRLIIPHIEDMKGLSVLAPGFKAILMTYSWWNKWQNLKFILLSQEHVLFLPQKTDWHSHSK